MLWVLFCFCFFCCCFWFVSFVFAWLSGRSPGLLALFLPNWPFHTRPRVNQRAHLPWTRFHTPPRDLCDNRPFIVWNLSAWSHTSKVSPQLHFWGLSPHRLHGYPNPHTIQSNDSDRTVIGSTGSCRLKQNRRLSSSSDTSDPNSWPADRKGLENEESRCLHTCRLINVLRNKIDATEYYFANLWSVRSLFETLSSPQIDALMGRLSRSYAN